MRRIGEAGFFVIFFITNADAAITAKITIENTLTLDVPETVVMPRITESAIVVAVARMSPITTGLTHEITVRTDLYFMKFRITDAIMRIITNDGRTSPRVAAADPRIPASDEPTNVAIFTAIGPGVDSATAIKFISSASVSHPNERHFSRMREIIPYPPPKDTAPISRKVRNSFK